MFEPLKGEKPTAATGQQAKMTREKQNRLLRQVVAKQFVTAREINGWQQSEAAAMMGYKNSTQLSLIEQGKRLPPPHVMLQASTVYSVSMDFLYGQSDDPDRDTKSADRAALMRHMEDILKANAEAVSKAMILQLSQGGSPRLVLQGLHSASTEFLTSVRRFQALNSKFDNMRGGSPVLAAASKLEAAMKDSAAVMARIHGLQEHLIKTAEVKAGVTHPLLDLINAANAKVAQ